MTNLGVASQGESEEAYVNMILSWDKELKSMILCLLKLVYGVEALSLIL